MTLETRGLLAAILSSALGGTAVATTRYLAPVLDPVTMGAIRFLGGGFILAALVGLLRQTRPPRADWPGVAALGCLFFGLFPVLFNAAMIHTTAARGALALSTLPLLTMAAGALLGIEKPTLRKGLGILIAMAGLATALGASLAEAPPRAWLGDLLMVAAAICMALYNVWSRPFVARSGALSFAATGMIVGAACLTAVSFSTGGAADIVRMSRAGILAALYLALVCGALIFFLWAYALGKTSPTLVAVTVAINPVTATLLGLVMLGEAVQPSLVVGLVAVLAGILVASELSPWRRSS